MPLNNKIAINESQMDANASVTGNALFIGTKDSITLVVVAVSGTHDTHQIEVEYSADLNTWTLCGSWQTGIGIKTGITCSGPFMRAKVKTLEGSDSVVDVYLEAK